MRAQVRLLQMLVNFCDLYTEAFNLDGKPLRIQVEDIYFIIGFSCWGEVVNLKYMGFWSGMNIEDYITNHSIAGREKVGNQLPIRMINNLILKIVILMLTQIVGSSLLHYKSRPMMFYSMECLQTIVYDWCTSLLANMKSHLADCKHGKKRNFGFTSIFCSFLFERVLGLSPRVDISPHIPSDSTMS
jgi:hypothetical protein